MEHRWGTRLPVTLDVSLIGRDRSVMHGQLRNIGPEGMFVHLEAAVLAENVAVEVELPLGETNRRVKAWVVHSSEDGAGLLLFAPDDNDYRRLLHAAIRQQLGVENGEAR